MLGNTFGLAINGCGCVVSDNMLISIVSVLVKPLQMSCAEAVDALAAQAGDLKVKDLLSPLHLMCLFKQENSS